MKRIVCGRHLGRLAALAACLWLCGCDSPSDNFYPDDPLAEAELEKLGLELAVGGTQSGALQVLLQRSVSMPQRSALAARTPALLPALLTVLRDRSNPNRLAAMQLLILAAPASTPALPEVRQIAADGGENAVLRQYALLAWARLAPRNTEALPFTRDWLQQDRPASEKVLPAFARALLDPQAPDAWPAVGAMLKSKDDAVKSAAIGGCILLGAECRPALPALLELVGNPAADPTLKVAEVEYFICLAFMGADGVAVLTKALADESPGIRQHALTALAFAGPEARAAVPAVVANLKHAQPVVRSGALRLLPRLVPVPETMPKLMAALEDEDSSVTSTAAKLIKDLGPAAAPFLAEGLKHPSPRVRAQAVTLLSGGPEDVETLPVLTRALDDADAAVREAALRALGAKGPKAKAALPAILDALRRLDRDNVVLLAASFQTVAADEDVEPPAALRTVATALTKIAAGPDALAGAMRDQAPTVRYTVMLALKGMDAAAQPPPALLDALQDPDERVRHAAVEALAALALEAPATPAALSVCLADGSWRVQLAAAQALARLGPAARRCVAPLVKAVHPGNHPEVRAAAARALGYIGPDAKEALPCLTGTVTDKVLLVRAEAALAMRKIQGDFRAGRKGHERDGEIVEGILAEDSKESGLPGAASLLSRVFRVRQYQVLTDDGGMREINLYSFAERAGPALGKNARVRAIMLDSACAFRVMKAPR